nr:glycosyltransferase [Prosthecomicrobium pneumaticum]
MLAAANIDVTVIPVDIDIRFGVRLRRLIRTSPYQGSISPEDLFKIVEAAQHADFVFLNQVNLAGSIRGEAFADLRRKIVLLSHGAEVTDLLNHVRVVRKLPLSGRLRPSPIRAVHNVLSDEIAAREGIRAAVCLSPFDADFERWLGVSHVVWIPRTVVFDPLDWIPVPKRYGFLGTLDHAPNLAGLVSVLEALEASKTWRPDVRVVGGPERLGAWLTERFASVTYLGPLDEEAVRCEVSSWTALLNPIFCQGRGCSTKLAVALGWHIPIVTTTVGRRGYLYRQGAILTADQPESFIRAMKSLEDRDVLAGVRRDLGRAAESTPSIMENAVQFQRFMMDAFDI